MRGPHVSTVPSLEAIRMDVQPAVRHRPPAGHLPQVRPGAWSDDGQAWQHFVDRLLRLRRLSPARTEARLRKRAADERCLLEETQRDRGPRDPSESEKRSALRASE